MLEGSSAGGYRNQQSDAIRIRYDGKDVLDTGRASGIDKDQGCGLENFVSYECKFRKLLRRKLCGL
jgi:hypothetical protein